MINESEKEPALKDPPRSPLSRFVGADACRSCCDDRDGPRHPANEDRDIVWGGLRVSFVVVVVVVVVLCFTVPSQRSRCLRTRVRWRAGVDPVAPAGRRATP